MANEYCFKASLTPEFKLQIELGGYERLATLDAIVKAIHQMVKMGKWLEEKNVPDSEKDKYMPLFRNLLHSVSNLWSILEWAGVSEAEIREHVAMPF